MIKKTVGAALAGLLSFTVMAQEIPKELIDLGLKDCNASCTPSFGEKICTQLCSCSMNEFKKRMKLPAYLSLQANIVKGQVTKEERSLMDSIAKKCDAEIKMPVPTLKQPKPGEEVPAPGKKKKDDD